MWSWKFDGLGWAGEGRYGASEVGVNVIDTNQLRCIKAFGSKRDECFENLGRSLLSWLFWSLYSTVDITAKSSNFNKLHNPAMFYQSNQCNNYPIRPLQASASQNATQDFCFRLLYFLPSLPKLVVIYLSDFAYISPRWSYSSTPSRSEISNLRMFGQRFSGVRIVQPWSTLRLDLRYGLQWVAVQLRKRILRWSGRISCGLMCWQSTKGDKSKSGCANRLLTALAFV